jgi:hypothetical protein
MEQPIEELIQMYQNSINSERLDAETCEMLQKKIDELKAQITE